MFQIQIANVTHQKVKILKLQNLHFPNRHSYVKKRGMEVGRIFLSGKLINHLWCNKSDHTSLIHNCYNDPHTTPCKQIFTIISARSLPPLHYINKIGRKLTSVPLILIKCLKGSMHIVAIWNAQKCVLCKID